MCTIPIQVCASCAFILFTFTTFPFPLIFSISIHISYVSTVKSSTNCVWIVRVCVCMFKCVCLVLENELYTNVGKKGAQNRFYSFLVRFKMTSDWFLYRFLCYVLTYNKQSTRCIAQYVCEPSREITEENPSRHWTNFYTHSLRILNI